jgi:8-oxo-dGTP pyrophosphatase MutT (NUDIX family)
VTVTREYSAGGIVFRRDANPIRYLLVKDRFGRWTFPKGHIESGENAEQAALREVAEETGLVTVRAHGELRTIQYWFHWRGNRVLKKVTYYLFESVRPQEVCVQKSEGIDDFIWVPGEQALTLMGYKNNIPPMHDALARAPDLAQPAPPADESPEGAHELTT